MVLGLGTSGLHHGLLFDSRNLITGKKINRYNGLEVAPFLREPPECPSGWTLEEGQPPQEAEWDRRSLDWDICKPWARRVTLHQPFFLGLSFLICKMKGNWFSCWFLNCALKEICRAHVGVTTWGEVGWHRSLGELQPSDPRAAQLLKSLFVYVPTEISFKSRNMKFIFF